MEQVRMSGVPRIGVTQPQGSVTPISFKFRHVLFKVSLTCRPVTITHRLQQIGSDEVVLPKGMPISLLHSIRTSAVFTGAPSVFHIANWPVASPSAKKEIESMRLTHCVIPLPAYDETGTLIKPVEYRASLKGATAIIRFDLAHWSFVARDGRPPSDTFMANIRRIDVLCRLRNPQASQSTSLTCMTPSPPT